MERSKKEYICGKCAQVFDRAYDHRSFDIKDLPFGIYKRVYLRVKKFRVNCPECGVRQERLPWVQPYGRHTKRLAREVALACRSLRTLKEVAETYRLSSYQVKEIDKAFLKKTLSEPDYSQVRLIGMDELAIKKGHVYATRVVDLERRETLWMGMGRSERTLDKFYREVDKQGCLDQIEAVCMDEWMPFRKATKRWLPDAEIIWDRFHIEQRFNRIIDRIRNRITREIEEEQKGLLKGTKYLFLKNRENLTERQTSRLEQILKLNRPLSIVYILKEKLKQMWFFSDWDEVRAWLNDWIETAFESGIKELKQFAGGLNRHRRGIFAACDYGLNTSVIEGMNNMAKTIKRIAFGFHDVECFFMKIRAHGFKPKPAYPHKT